MNALTHCGWPNYSVYSIETEGFLVKINDAIFCVLIGLLPVDELLIYLNNAGLLSHISHSFMSQSN